MYRRCTSVCSIVFGRWSAARLAELGITGSLRLDGPGQRAGGESSRSGNSAIASRMVSFSFTLDDHRAAWISNARARRRRSRVSTSHGFGGPDIGKLLLLIFESAAGGCVGRGECFYSEQMFGTPLGKDEFVLLVFLWLLLKSVHSFWCLQGPARRGALS